MTTISIPVPAYSALGEYGIAILAILVAIFAAQAWSNTATTPESRRRQFLLAIGLISLWMLLTTFVARSGFLQRFDFFPPPMMLMIISVFLLAFTTGFSTVGKKTAIANSFTYLIGLQAFRFPLELVMHHLSKQGIMPVQLSYSGYNLDIVTGIGALLLALLLAAGKNVDWRWILIWNIWGFWCLAVIAFIAITTSPIVRLFGDDPANINTWVLFMPYTWLPAVMVTAAIAGHIIIGRKLRLERQQKSQ